MKTLFLRCILVSISVLSAAPSYADLGRLKRYIMRDCAKAEAIFDESGLAAPDATERPELLRYLSQVFKLNLNAQFEAPLVPGNLADPTDIWRSLSGESDVDSKLCALRLVDRIGTDGINTLAPAVSLLDNETSPPELKCAIAKEILDLWSKTKTPTTPSDSDGADSLRTALRELLKTAENVSTLQATSMLLTFGLDSTMLPNPQPPIIRSASTTPEAPSSVSKGKTKDRRVVYRALASNDESERESALVAISPTDIKALEGFRISGSRSEKVAASLAISHLGGKWMLDTSTTRSLDCGFASSFIPLTSPPDVKRRDDFSGLIARCLLVGRDEFLWQLVADPKLLDTVAIKLLIMPNRELEQFDTLRKLTVVLERLRPSSDGLAKLGDSVCEILSDTN